MKEYSGEFATVTGLSLEGLMPLLPDEAALLSYWFVHPKRECHPIWPHYLLLCVHLRDVPGQSEPSHRRTADATHQIMLVALNPELGPWSADVVTKKLESRWNVLAVLYPLNASIQPEGLTDAQAVHLTDLVASALAKGILPIECDDVYGQAIWHDTIRKTAEHIRTGGHHVDTGF